MTNPRAAELKQRLAAVNYGVEEQNSSQKSIGPGSREATNTTNGSNNPGEDGVAKQNSTQQSIHGEGKTKSKSLEESSGEMSHSSY